MLVKKENIIKINSMEQVMVGAVLIAGSFSGGMAAFFFGTDLTFWLNGLSFLLAAAIIYSIPDANPNRPVRKKGESDILHSLKTVKKFMAASAPLSIAFLFEFIVPLFKSKRKRQAWGMTDFRLIDPDGYFL
ncbi:MAG: hypothetical protein BAA03_02315 [Caldibacillus debilis]|nr:MAG: hypothetical protein BAA03_02315 [Caldibacillus debilis]